MVRICSYVPRPMKFAAFIDESVEKKKSIPGNTGVLKSYLKLQEKDYLNSNIYIFVNIRFSRTSIIIKSFKGNNFVQFRISSILYMYKNLPEAILLVNFGLFGENFQLLVLFTRK